MNRAVKAKSQQKRTLRPKACSRCAALTCEIERLEASRKEYRDAYLRVALTYHGYRGESIPMLDVMAKALESANIQFEIADYGWLKNLREKRELRIELSRKASVIEAYKRAWGKGQDGPVKV